MKRIRRGLGFFRTEEVLEIDQQQDAENMLLGEEVEYISVVL